jgi:hypothetical protein
MSARQIRRPPSAHSLAAIRGQVSTPFAEEDTVEAVLLGSVGLGVPMLGVVGQVLGHRRIGVEPYLWHVKGAVLGQGQQPCSDVPA